MKLGILGGSFNPPHNGHIYIARQVMHRLGLDKVLFMVAGDPPHKSIAFGVDAEKRFALTQAALEAQEGLIASDAEIRRGGVSYTIDTLRSLYNGQDELYLIVGADMLQTLHTWREAESIMRIANIIAVGRPENGSIAQAAAALRQNMGANVFCADIEGPAISSTLVRSRVNCAQGISELVPQLTMQRIYSNLLYQSDDILAHAQKLKASIKPTRFAHSLAAMGTAVELAQIWGEDGKKARMAALLHDCAKLGDEQALMLAREYGYTPNEEETRSPGLLHGPLGAIRAQREYGIEDKAILCAIGCHVCGRVGMNALDKILYVADKAEYTRAYPMAQRLRQLAEQSLTGAAIAAMENSIDHLAAQGLEATQSSTKIIQSLKNELAGKEF